MTLYDALAAVRAVRATAARGDRLGAVNAYLRACNAHAASFGRAPATSRTRVHRAILAVKPLALVDSLQCSPPRREPPS